MQTSIAPYFLAIALLGALAGCDNGQEYYLANGGIQYLVLGKPNSTQPEIVSSNLNTVRIESEMRAEREGDDMRLVTTLVTGQSMAEFLDADSSWTSTIHLERIDGTQDYRANKYTLNWGGKHEPAHTSYEPPSPFLHRVKSPRIVEYFDGAYQLSIGAQTSVTTTSLVELTKELMAAEPDELYYRILHFDALLRADQFTELESKLREWSQEFAALSDEKLQDQVRRFETACRWRELELAGINGDTFREQLLDPSRDLQTRLKLLPELLKHDQALLRPYIIGHELLAARQSNFLEHQILVKVVRVYSVFRLFEGKRNEALEYLAASYRLGQLLYGEAQSILRTIAVALRSIALNGIEFHLMNACETEDEVRHAWDMIERLYRMDVAQASLPNQPLSPVADPDDDLPIRAALVDAKMALLRSVAAAQMKVVTHQELPTTASDFAPLLPDGLPADPFTSQPLRFLPGDHITLYSTGPDKTDDHAQITYDPTNGTLSRGDVLTTLGKVRRYPFPRDGVRASSRDELMRQFSNGLPLDPFNDNRLGPLRATYTSPLTIYSVGPDTDEARIAPIEQTYAPTVQYDPTNGTISRGDFFITLPGN